MNGVKWPDSLNAWPWTSYVGLDTSAWLYTISLCGVLEMRPKSVPVWPCPRAQSDTCFTKICSDALRCSEHWTHLERNTSCSHTASMCLRLNGPNQKSKWCYSRKVSNSISKLQSSILIWCIFFNSVNIFYFLLPAVHSGAHTQTWFCVSTPNDQLERVYLSLS